ncbi:MAG TPA: hypothetical protein VI386_11385, partial [Candidatus Sulfotelmatobacter sp.]
MNFRRKLLLVFTFTVALSVAGVAFLVSLMTRRAFAHNEDQRTASLMAQFQREFDAQGKEIARRVESIVASEPFAHMAAALDRAPGDSAAYFDLAKSLAENYQLDFLEFVDSNGLIVSSAQWPAKFGYPENAFPMLGPLAGQPPFLKQEEVQDSSALGLFSVGANRLQSHELYALGGRRLDKQFLGALDLPADTRVLLYQIHGNTFSADSLIGSLTDSTTQSARSSDKLWPLILATSAAGKEMTAIIHWTS